MYLYVPNSREIAAMMDSGEYKERFRAEYWEIKIRYEQKRDMLIKMDAARAMAEMVGHQPDYTKFLGFTPTCPYEMISEQCCLLRRYLDMLETQAVMEEIDLTINVPSN